MLTNEIVYSQISKKSANLIVFLQLHKDVIVEKEEQIADLREQIVMGNETIEKINGEKEILKKVMFLKVPYNCILLKVTFCLLPVMLDAPLQSQSIMQVPMM